MSLLIDEFNNYYKSLENELNNSELIELKKYGDKLISEYIYQRFSNKKRLRIKKDKIKIL